MVSEKPENQKIIDIICASPREGSAAWRPRTPGSKINKECACCSVRSVGTLDYRDRDFETFRLSLCQDHWDRINMIRDAAPVARNRNNLLFLRKRGSINPFHPDNPSTGRNYAKSTKSL